MADHVWTVLCRMVSIDKDTNNVSMFSTIEQLGLSRQAGVSEESLPDNIAFDMVLMSLWTRSEPTRAESSACRVIVKGSTGKELSRLEPKIDLNKHARYRLRVNFPALPFDGFGRYEFVVQERTRDGKWRKVALLPVDIREEAAGTQPTERGT